jgi:ribosomal protein S25
MLSVAVVKEKYNIKVSDDVAEAILIGRYGVMTHGGVKISMAFGEK